MSKMSDKGIERRRTKQKLQAVPTTFDEWWLFNGQRMLGLDKRQAEIVFLNGQLAEIARQQVEFKKGVKRG